MNENDSINGLIEETVREMKEKIDAITDTAGSIETEESRDTVEEIKDRAVSILSNVTRKLSSLAEEVLDPEEIGKTLDYVKTKAKELTDNTMRKFDELKKQDALQSVKKAGEDLVENISNNETVQNVFNNVSDGAAKAFETIREGAEDLLEKADQNETVAMAKAKTVEIAEKAVNALKQWLRPDDNKEDGDES